MPKTKPPIRGILTGPHGHPDLVLEYTPDGSESYREARPGEAKGLNIIGFYEFNGAGIVVTQEDPFAWTPEAKYRGKWRF